MTKAEFIAEYRPHLLAHLTECWSSVKIGKGDVGNELEMLKGRLDSRVFTPMIHASGLADMAKQTFRDKWMQRLIGCWAGYWVCRNDSSLICGARIDRQYASVSSIIEAMHKDLYPEQPAKPTANGKPATAPQPGRKI